MDLVDLERINLFPHAVRMIGSTGGTVIGTA
jgi:hypothetical protein